MKITNVEKEQGAALLRIVVEEADYAAEVEKMLRDYKRKANIPGYRPGMVPMGIIKKMYGKGVVAEQAYRKASNAAFEYLQKEKIDYIGDVIPAEEQGDFDFDNNTTHEFVFEYGVAPKYDVKLTAKDKITYHKIKIDKKMHASFLDNYLRRYGSLKDVDKVKKDEALNVTLDNGDIRIEEAYVGLISMSDEERKPFIGKKVGYKTEVDINELYKNPAQRASILQVKENELEGINPKFSLEITKIRQFANPELNEEFFKMAFPEGNVTNEEQLNAFIDEQIASELKRESDYLFTFAVRDFLIEKAALAMPTEFLKRWLYTINEGKFTMEDIEKDFDAFLKMFTWNYIQRRVIEAEKISVSADEAKAEAKVLAAAQFAQYGMPNAPEEMLENFSKNILDNKEQSQKIYEKLYEQKVVESVSSKVKVTEKAVSAEDFAELAKNL
ncbi:MAG: trigger factor [Rikenellaceae bacterium]|nr:trigger factor [Rikenellaceae bacterium]